MGRNTKRSFFDDPFPRTSKNDHKEKTITILKRTEPIDPFFNSKSLEDPLFSKINHNMATKMMNTLDTLPKTLHGCNSHSETNNKPYDNGSAGKHPLQFTWSLFYYKSDFSKNWNLNNIMLKNVNTVEDFWALYNYVKPSSGLSMGNGYSLFKKGIKPEWEDPNNVKGGRWILNMDRNQNPHVNSLWCDTMLALIGNTWGDWISDQVCGAVLNLRVRGHNISIWTADANKETEIMRIGQHMRITLKLPANVKLEYYEHQSNLNKRGNQANVRYYL